MTKLAAFRRLSRTEQRLVLEAFLGLGLARCLLLAVPFKRITPFLTRTTESRFQLPEDHQMDMARPVARAIGIVSRHTPWQNACLVQAMAGSLMLKRRSIPSTLVLGLRRNESELEAHAWLKVNGQALLGGPAAPGFKAIASFGGEVT